MRWAGIFLTLPQTFASYSYPSHFILHTYFVAIPTRLSSDDRYGFNIFRAVSLLSNSICCLCIIPVVIQSSANPEINNTYLANKDTLLLIEYSEIELICSSPRVGLSRISNRRQLVEHLTPLYP